MNGGPFQNSLVDSQTMSPVTGQSNAFSILKTTRRQRPPLPRDGRFFGADYLVGEPADVHRVAQGRAKGDDREDCYGNADLCAGFELCRLRGLRLHRHIIGQWRSGRQAALKTLDLQY